jgi:hypothetical protein
MMKKIFYSLAVVAALTSCKKFLDVNTTPNSAVDVPPKVLLPTTSVGIAWTNANTLGMAAEVLMQHNAGILGDPDAFDAYTLENQFENQWNLELYPVIKNLRIIINKTQANSPAYSGIAKIQMAYQFSLATDLWGDVPYSQAGYGSDLPQPRFDAQQDIYLGNPALNIVGLFDLVRDGLADLDKPTATKPTTDDIIYGGDLDKWKRAGNTLLLKLGIQVSNVKPDVAKSVIASAIASNKLITDNSQDMEVKFFAAGKNQNPVYSYETFSGRAGEYMMSARFLNLMKSLNDTVRLGKFYTKPNGVFVGFENGANVAAPVLANRSRYNVYITGTSGEAPVRLITNFQRAFILAESALLFGTAGDPNTLYQEGIRASMKKTGMTDAEINMYFADNPAVVNLSGTTENKRQQIITQKYIAWVGNGIEAYNDYRRTGYPMLAVALNATGDDPNVIPKRYPYSTTESQRNPFQPNPRPRTNEKVWWGL